MSLTTPVKPDYIIDNTTLNNIFGRGSNFNAEFGINLLNVISDNSNIVIADVIRTEILANPNYGGVNGIFDTWMKGKGIIPMVTGVNSSLDNAGELSMNKAFDILKAAGHDVVIVSDDVNFYNERLNTDGSYKSPQGAPYVEHTKQIQDIANEFLRDGKLPITDYQIIRNNNATMNKGNPDVTQFWTDAQSFNETPTAEKLGYVADETGIVTDTKTGNKFSLSEGLKNLLIDESGSSGSLAGVAHLLGMDVASLENAILRGTVGLSGVALTGLGIVAMTQDILQTAEKARAQLDSGDLAGAIASVESLAVRTGLAITGAEVGYVLGLAGAAWLGVIGGPAFVAAGLIGATVGAIAGGMTGTELVNAINKAIEPLAHALADLIDKAWPGIADSMLVIGDTLSAAYSKFLDAVHHSLHIDPLVIDMAGNGIALNSWQNSGVLFDLNGDGVKEKSGWTKANGDDAFLVIDKNSNGNIDNISEMFGNANTAGFVDLKSYDSNGDNIINASDSQFGLLRLWNDKNPNGKVDAGELTTLAQNNITSISLNSYGNPASIEGNIQIASSDVTFSNGTTKVINELAFGFENTNTITTNPDANLPAGFQINIAALIMPYSRGYNSLHSWQVAMTLDPTLLAMAQDIMVTTPANFYKINEKFESFLFRWAGVENVTPAQVYGGTISSFDARKVAFMEKITGLDLINGNTPTIKAAQQAWDMFFNDFLTRFMVQGPLHDSFPNASYDFASDTLNFGGTLDEIIAGVKAHAVDMGANEFVNYVYYTSNILELNKSQFTDPAFDSKVQTMLRDVIGAEVPGFTFDGRLNFGTSEPDILFGTAKNDILHGEGGNDELYGYAASKIIEKYSYFSAVANDNCVDGLFLYVKIA